MVTVRPLLLSSGNCKEFVKFLTNKSGGLFGDVMSTILHCSAHDVLSYLLHTLKHRGSQAGGSSIGIGNLNLSRRVVLGQGTPIERRKRLRECRWSSNRGYARLEKMKSFLESEPIQGVFQTYTGRRWKAWKYRGWVEEG